MLGEVNLPEEVWLFEEAHRLYTRGTECWRSFSEWVLGRMSTFVKPGPEWIPETGHCGHSVCFPCALSTIWYFDHVAHPRFEPFASSAADALRGLASFGLATHRHRFHPTRVEMALR